MNFDDSVHFGFFFRSAFRQINGQNTIAGIGADFFLNHIFRKNQSLFELRGGEIST